MGTTTDKLNKILESKENIRQAILDKGVEIDDTTPFSGYAAKISEISGVTPPLTGLPHKEGLYGLFELDNFDEENKIWRNKIVGNNDMVFSNYTLSDEAICLPGSQRAYIDCPTMPYTFYAVIKKPVIDNNKWLFGNNYDYSASGSGRYFGLWNNGNENNSLVEATGCSSGFIYYYPENLDFNKYYVITYGNIKNKRNEVNYTNNGCLTYLYVNGEYVQAKDGDMTIHENQSTYYLKRVTLGERERENGWGSGQLYPTYYKFFAFGRQDDMQQILDNAKYLYEKYAKE